MIIHILCLGRFGIGDLSLMLRKRIDYNQDRRIIGFSCDESQRVVITWVKMF